MSAHSKTRWLTLGVLFPFVLVAAAWTQEEVEVDPPPPSVTATAAREIRSGVATADLQALSAVLYDQLDSPETPHAVISTELTNFSNHSAIGADDFVVPQGKRWILDAVHVPGTYTNDNASQLLSVHLLIYSDGLNGPGAIVCPNFNLPLSSLSDQNGNWTVTLPFGCVLNEGRHWISVQARASWNGNGTTWYWGTRSVQSLQSGKWRNPGNGYGTGCTQWSDLAPCYQKMHGILKAQDWRFRLHGVAQDVVVPSTGPLRPHRGSARANLERPQLMVGGLSGGYLGVEDGNFHYEVADLAPMPFPEIPVGFERFYNSRIPFHATRLPYPTTAPESLARFEPLGPQWSHSYNDHFFLGDAAVPPQKLTYVAEDGSVYFFDKEALPDPLGRVHYAPAEDSRSFLARVFQETRAGEGDFLIVEGTDGIRREFAFGPPGQYAELRYVRGRYPENLVEVDRSVPGALLVVKRGGRELLRLKGSGGLADGLERGDGAVLSGYTYTEGFLTGARGFIDWSYEYDPSSLRLDSILRSGAPRLTVQYLEDAWGNVLPDAFSDGNGNVDDPEYVGIAALDGLATESSLTDRAGALSTYRFEPTGYTLELSSPGETQSLFLVVEKDERHNPTYLSDFNGVETRHGEYNLFGSPGRIAVGPDGSPDQQVTVKLYDELNRPTQIVNPRSFATTFVYEPAGAAAFTSLTTTGPAGHADVVRVSAADGLPEGLQEGPLDPALEPNHRRDLAVSRAPNEDQIRDEESGRVVKSEYDLWGRTEYVTTSAPGSSTRIETTLYNDWGFAVERRLQFDDTSPATIWKETYDAGATGLLTERMEGGITYLFSEHDGNGNSGKKTGGGLEVRYAYDALDRLRIEESEETAVSSVPVPVHRRELFYDGLGRVERTVTGTTEIARTFWELPPLGSTARTSNLVATETVVSRPGDTVPDLVTSYTYDELGRVATITEGERTRVYTYDLQDNLVELSDAGLSIHQIWNPLDQLSTRTVGALSDAYQYTPTGILLEHTDPSGVTARRVLDGDDRPFRSYRAGVLLTETTYDAFGNESLVLDFRSATERDATVISRSYDTVGEDLRATIETTLQPPAGSGDLPVSTTRVTSMVTGLTHSEKRPKPGGNGSSFLTTTYSYDANLRLERAETDGSPRRSESFVYDGFGNQIERTLVEQGATRKAEYDVNSRPIELLDEAGGRHATIYNANGSIREEWSGRHASDVDSRRSILYDQRGRPSQIADAVRGTSEHFTYHTRGQVHLHTDARGSVTEHLYDDLDRLERMIFRDSSTGKGDLEIRYEHDALGRVRKQKLHQGDSEQRAKEWVYNDLGQLERLVDFDGVPSSFRYDFQGNLTESDTPGGKVSYEERNAAGQPRKVSLEGLFTETIEYHHPGGPVEERSRGGSEISSTLHYDDWGRPTREERRGAGGYREEVVFGYQSFPSGGSSVLETLPSGTRYSFFDAAGRLTARNEGGIYQELYWEHDSLGRPRRLTLGSRSLRQEYRGLVQRSIASSGATNELAYDGNGNLVRMTSPGGAFGSSSETTSYQYDVLDRPRSITYPDGKRVVYLYDGWDPVGITYPDGSSVALSPNASGQLEKVKVVADGLETAIGYGYDSRGLVNAESLTYSPLEIPLFQAGHDRRGDGSMGFSQYREISTGSPARLNYSWRLLESDESGRVTSWQERQTREVGFGLTNTTSLTYEGPQVGRMEFRNETDGVTYSERYRWRDGVLEESTREVGGAVKTTLKRTLILNSAGRPTLQTQELFGPKSSADFPNPNDILLQGTIRYDYDAAGNLVQESLVGEVVAVELGWENGPDFGASTTLCNGQVAPPASSYLNSKGSASRRIASITYLDPADESWLVLLPALGEKSVRITVDPRLLPAPDREDAAQRVYEARAVVTLEDPALGRSIDLEITYTLTVLLSCDGLSGLGTDHLPVAVRFPDGRVETAELPEAVALVGQGPPGAYTLSLFGSYAVSEPLEIAHPNGEASVRFLGAGPDETAILLAHPFVVGPGVASLEFEELALGSSGGAQAIGSAGAEVALDVSFTSALLEGFDAVVSAEGPVNARFRHVTVAADPASAAILRTSSPIAKLVFQDGIAAVRVLVASGQRPAPDHNTLLASDLFPTPLAWQNASNPADQASIADWASREVIELDPQFDAPGFRLKAGSPAERSASDGYDMGAYWLDGQAADLSASILEATPVPGGHRVVVRVSNEGERDAGAFSLKALRDGEEILSETRDGLPAGESLAEIPLTVLQEEALASFRFEVDSDNEVREISEANNGVSRDLHRDRTAPFSIAPSTAPAWTGREGTVLWQKPLDPTVGADGLPEIAPLASGRYLLTLTRLDSGAQQIVTSPVAAGESASVTLSWAAPGDYSVTVHAIDGEDNEGSPGPPAFFTTRVGTFGDRTVELPPAYVGERYRADVRALGGYGVVTHRLVEGALPEGLQVTPDGFLEGVPSPESLSGSPYTGITIEAVDQNFDRAVIVAENALEVAAAVAPSWWARRGVLTGAPAKDFAAVNQGQLKHLASMLRDEMDAILPGGAGDVLDALVDALPRTGNYAPVNLGQLKNLAKPFYDRLGWPYVWTEETTDDRDFAMANVGQVKNVFKLDPGRDTDRDGLPDWWEWKYFAGITSAIPEDDADCDLATNAEEYRNGTDPLAASQQEPATVAAPVLEPNGGTFPAAVEVRISTATPGAAIFYTLDGAPPGAGATRYSGPFTLGVGLHDLRAIATHACAADSPVTAARFDVQATAAP